MLPSLLKNIGFKRSQSSVSPERKKVLLELKKKLGLNIKDLDLLEKSFRHSSYVHEKKMPGTSNETLEFFGDSVLGLVVSEYLYKNFPTLTEGDLSQLKSVVVSAAILAKKAREMELGKYLLLGKGEEQSGARERGTLLADTLEALIGALYLDGELKAVRPFILQQFSKEIEKVYGEGQWQDYKSLLQEMSQRKWRVPPYYHVIAAHGPDHDKTFVVRVSIRDKVFGVGRGKSKKEAEQIAARKALGHIKMDSHEPAKGTAPRPTGNHNP